MSMETLCATLIHHKYFMNHLMKIKLSAVMWTVIKRKYNSLSTLVNTYGLARHLASLFISTGQYKIVEEPMLMDPAMDILLTADPGKFSGLLHNLLVAEIKVLRDSSTEAGLDSVIHGTINLPSPLLSALMSPPRKDRFWATINKEMSCRRMTKADGQSILQRILEVLQQENTNHQVPLEVLHNMRLTMNITSLFAKNYQYLSNITGVLYGTVQHFIESNISQAFARIKETKKGKIMGVTATNIRQLLVAFWLADKHKINIPEVETLINKIGSLLLHNMTKYFARTVSTVYFG